MKIQVITTPLAGQIQRFQKGGYLRPDELINSQERNIIPQIKPSKLVSENQYFSPSTLIKSVKESSKQTAEKINFMF